MIGLRLVQRNALVYKRTWLIIVSGFFEPFFYLLSIGLGIGSLVGDVAGPTGRPVSYASFVAPALLAASAMNGAVFDTTFNVFYKLKWAKVYDAVLATPRTVLDVAVGETTWALIRGSLYAITFLVVMLVMGLVHSWWALLALPVCVLIGYCFAGIGMASTSFVRGWADFDITTFVTLVLFVFSATFYPLATYPRWLQIVAQFSPLYHGVALLRTLCLGGVTIGAVGHALVLAVLGSIGLSIAARRLQRLLQP